MQQSSATMLDYANTHTVQREVDKGHVIMCTPDFSDCIVRYQMKNGKGVRYIGDCTSSKNAIRQFMTCRVPRAMSGRQFHFVEDKEITFTISQSEKKSHTLNFKTPQDMVEKFDDKFVFMVDGINWDHYPTDEELRDAMKKRDEEQMRRVAEMKAKLDKAGCQWA